MMLIGIPWARARGTDKEAVCTTSYCRVAGAWLRPPMPRNENSMSTRSDFTLPCWIGQAAAMNTGSCWDANLITSFASAPPADDNSAAAINAPVMGRENLLIAGSPLVTKMSARTWEHAPPFRAWCLRDHA